MDNLFDLQDAFRSKIVQALKIKLSTREEQWLARRQTDNPQAYDLYLQGLGQVSFFTREGNLESRSLFQKVIELDPSDPRVWLDLAGVHADLREYPVAVQTLLDGLKHHENQADFYYSIAYFLVLDGKQQEAHEFLFKAMDMDSDGYKRLLTAFPDAEKHPAVMDIISSYKKE